MFASGLNEFRSPRLSSLVIPRCVFGVSIQNSNGEISASELWPLLGQRQCKRERKKTWFN